MVTIKDALALEHVFLGRLFHEIDCVLPEVRTVAEVRFLCRIVENLLSHHADVEQNLAYVALDHALAERGDLDQMYEDHEEIDARFEHARTAADVNEARRLLMEGLEISAHHFRWEERSVFPLFDQVFAPATLKALAATAMLPGGDGSADGAGDAPVSTRPSPAANWDER